MDLHRHEDGRLVALDTKDRSSRAGRCGAATRLAAASPVAADEGGDRRVPARCAERSDREPRKRFRLIAGLAAAPTKSTTLSGTAGTRRPSRAALLEALREVGDLVPGAEVPLEIDVGDGLEWRQVKSSGGGRGAAGAEQAEQQ